MHCADIAKGGQMVARENYIHTDTRMIWRRKDEQNLPKPAGHDHYQKQVPPSRMIPLWGGVGPGGFAPILWHSERKTNHEEWSAAVRAGSLTSALRAVNPGKRTGPWKVLCDNESFLEHAESLEAYRKPRISLVHIPAKSPDVNPVEKFWGWARKRLHKMDLADLSAGRVCLCFFELVSVTVSGPMMDILRKSRFPSHV